MQILFEKRMNLYPSSSYGLNCTYIWKNHLFPKKIINAIFTPKEKNYPYTTEMFQI